LFYTYILYSPKCDRYYIGASEDPLKRLARHNAGQVTSTKNCRPYNLLKSKEFKTFSEALSEERRLKKMKSRVYIEKILKDNW
jgi:putative endonuclease